MGQIQEDVPWPTQRAGIVEGLKRAGDIAAAAGVAITLETQASEAAADNITPIWCQTSGRA